MSEEDIKQMQINENDYEILFTELKKDLAQQIVYISNEAIKQNRLEKDAAKNIVQKLRETEKFESLGQGEWQCFIGRQLCASLSYDTGVMIFFYLKKEKKNVLLFKSQLRYKLNYHRELDSSIKHLKSFWNAIFELT